MVKKKAIQCLFSFKLMNYKKGTLNTHLSILDALEDIAYPTADLVNSLPLVFLYVHCQQWMPCEKDGVRGKIIALCHTTKD